MELKNSKTQENLYTAFLKESGAYSEYTFFASQAKKDGYERIYNVFNDFAKNEQAHAKVWFKLFHGIFGTEDNLKDAADLEKFERSVLYPKFAETARAEGFDDIALLFEGVADVERRHEEKFKSLLQKVKKKEFFCAEDEILWRCENCGHIHKGQCAPQKCPVCAHPQAFFAPFNEEE